MRWGRYALYDRFVHAHDLEVQLHLPLPHHGPMPLPDLGHHSAVASVEDDVFGRLRGKRIKTGGDTGCESKASRDDEVLSVHG